ncbi:MAG TPA: lysophospholipid acyltransferase family protein, partial [Longimicrobiales bacterium]|nr:lysophospholipid acyltransferase family protein [Longimicrobiales bacterium]
DRRMRSGLRYSVVKHAGGAVLDALMRTTRLHVTNDRAYRERMEQGRPVIFALWHGRLLPLGFVHRGQNIVCLASRSSDGEYITRVLQHWGLGVVRGSSSSGGDRAFRELIRVVRAGRSVAVTPDGPRGPRERMKPGVLQLAQLTGVPIVPLAAAASRSWWFVSWDRFLIPQPFARLHVEYGDPIFVSRDAGDLTDVTAHTEAVLTDLMSRVEEAAAR